MKKKNKKIENNEQAQKIACAKKTSIGGQALMEGIMMRGPKKSAMAVRNPKGEIVLEITDISSGKRPFITKIPIARGVYNFISSMIIGYKALMRSAEISGLEEIEEEMAREKAAKKAAKKGSVNKDASAEETTVEKSVAEETTVEESVAEETTVEESVAEETIIEETITEEATLEDTTESSNDIKTPEKKKSSGLMTLITVISGVLGVALAIGLFIFLPNMLADWLADFTPYPLILSSVFAGILRIIILVIYMALVCLLKDIRRTFEYHGAEHKTIFCYEAGLELTVENVRKQRRFHPRCGTSFLILMLLISIATGIAAEAAYIAIFNKEAEGIVITLVKFCLLPLTMGIGYELIKLAGRHDNVFTRIISAPGMWLQRLTVKEPSDDMIECAIKAFEAVVPEDNSDNY